MLRVKAEEASYGPCMATDIWRERQQENDNIGGKIESRLAGVGECDGSGHFRVWETFKLTCGRTRDEMRAWT